MQRYGYSHKSAKILRILTFELRIFGWFMTMDGGFGKTAAYRERSNDNNVNGKFLGINESTTEYKTLIFRYCTFT